MPGFVDCHTHGPQFPNHGLGSNCPLLERLDKYIYPIESQYHNIEFAKRVYAQVVVSTFLHVPVPITSTKTRQGVSELSHTIQILTLAV